MATISSTTPSVPSYPTTVSPVTAPKNIAAAPAAEPKDVAVYPPDTDTVPTDTTTTDATPPASSATYTALANASASTIRGANLNISA